jgi:hypothetical protein
VTISITAVARARTFRRISAWESLNACILGYYLIKYNP